ncbi:MAG: lanthionine synthetase LanC family protein [Gaiellales bacterium]
MIRYELPPDTRVFPATAATRADLRRARADAADWVVSRTRSRKSSRVVDGPGARLLEEFRSPKSIAEAVLRFSEREGLVPDRVLDDSFSFISTMIGAGFLVEDRDGGSVATPEELASGDRIEGWEVVQLLQHLEDTAVAIVRNRDGREGVLKLVFEAAPGWVSRALHRERAMLERIGGPPAPLLLDAGSATNGDWLVSERLPGSDALAAAARLRRPWAPNESGRVIELAAAIARTYGELHGLGFLHGDVHPRNVLVDGDSVRLVDFGLASEPARPQSGPAPRGGLLAFYPPEAATAALAGKAPPPATPASEIAAIGALLYRVVTGESHAVPTLVERELLGHLASGETRRFVDVGLPANPEVEAILRECLSADPAARPASAAVVADRLSGAASLRLRPGRRNRPGVAEAVLGRLFGPRAADQLVAPTASLAYGAAGSAIVLLRASETLLRPELLAAAERLVARAMVAAVGSDPDGFHAPAIGIDAESIGERSVVFGRAGVLFAAAIVGEAATDSRMATTGLQGFLEIASADEQRGDLMSGRAGLLLGCAHLAAWSRVDRRLAAELRRCGDALAADVELLAAPTSLPLEGTSAQYLGIAHGTAGVLYALLAWHRVCETRPSPETLARLAELAGRAAVSDERRSWPRRNGSDESWPGWCHGSAGFALLWSLAYELTGEASYLDALLGAATDAATYARGRSGHLCCGDAGRAYAQLAAFRATGDGAWVDRASSLLESAAATIGTRTMRRDSLLKGDLGVAALELDLLAPERSGFPLFELPR